MHAFVVQCKDSLYNACVTDISGADLGSLVPRPMFSERSGDVIHPQLWESGSGYETRIWGGGGGGGGGGGLPFPI